MPVNLVSVGGGTTTLSPASSASSYTITLPAVTGTVLTNKSAGTIVQVVNATSSTQVATTSTSFVTSGLTLNITPTSSSNKILVLATLVSNDNSTYQQTFFTIARNGTNLGNASYGMTQWYGNVNNPFTIPVALSYLDSPATTSSTTYAVYFRSGAGQTVTVNPGSNFVISITAQEVAV